MFRRRLTVSSLCLGLAVTAAGCGRELGAEKPEVDLSTIVVAQFDPTNPIPVLQLVPSPTALAQNPATGFIDKDAVRPEPCELPTTSQCLEFVNDAWPINVLPTLYFSGDLDETTIAAGIKLFRATATGLEEVAYTPVVQPRTPVNPACQAAFGYDASAIPPGNEVILRPEGNLLMPNSQYFVAIQSWDGGGLRAADGDLVYASGLFSLLNAPNEPGVTPVLEDGTIQSALLRSQVQGRALAELSDEEMKPVTSADLAADAALASRFQMKVAATGARLRGLYLFFDATMGALLQSQKVAQRDHAVLVNTWRTGGTGATVVNFDPANGAFPFPNNQLMTRPSEADPTVLQVALPPDPRDSPTAAALKVGLNTLDGFSTTAPMVITASRNLDVSTVNSAIVMYALNATGVPTGDPIPLVIGTSSATADAPFTITIRPALPLEQNTNHVVGVLAGMTDTNGNPVQTQSTFNLLKVPGDFTGAALPAVFPALQCSTLGTLGRLATEVEVMGIAAQLETQLMHQRWLQAFAALEAAPTPIPRTNVVMAWTYKTQTLTGTVDVVKNQLLPGVWDRLDANPRVVGPLVDVRTSTGIAALFQLANQLCVTVCRQGAFEDPGGANHIPRDQCTMNGAATPAVTAHPTCRLALQIATGSLTRARLYLMKSYDATVGNPYVAGTFTPATIMTPAVTDRQIWVLEGGGTPPAEGRPVAIFQHGLGQVKESGIMIANSIATSNTQGGWATILMDLPYHGTRASDLTMNMNGTEIPCTDEMGRPNVDPADVACNPQTGQCAGGCDGVRDSSGTGFLSSNLFGTRDNFRQATLDHLTLLFTLQAESQAGGAWQFMDGTRVGYIGQSLGAITGGAFLAYAEPDEIQAAVLNVGGGSLTTILLNAIPQISAPLFAALERAGVCVFNVPNNPASGCQNTPAFRQFLLSAQWVLDPADPLALSVAVRDRLGPSNILMQMSLPDPVVTNISTLALANAYGFAIDGSDDQFQVYDFAAAGVAAANVGSGCHGFLLAPTCGVGASPTEALVDALCYSLGAQQQAITWIDSDASTILDQRPAAVGGLLACQ